jgi:hypothetical protein
VTLTAPPVVGRIAAGLAADIDSYAVAEIG